MDVEYQAYSSLALKISKALSEIPLPEIWVYPYGIPVPLIFPSVKLNVEVVIDTEATMTASAGFDYDYYIYTGVQYEDSWGYVQQITPSTGSEFNTHPVQASMYGTAKVKVLMKPQLVLKLLGVTPLTLGPYFGLETTIYGGYEDHCNYGISYQLSGLAGVSLKWNLFSVKVGDYSIDLGYSLGLSFSKDIKLWEKQLTCAYCSGCITTGSDYGYSDDEFVGPPAPTVDVCNDWTCDFEGQQCTAGTGWICCNEAIEGYCDTPPCWVSGSACSYPVSFNPSPAPTPPSVKRPNSCSSSSGMPGECIADSLCLAPLTNEQNRCPYDPAGVYCCFTAPASSPSSSSSPPSSTSPSPSSSPTTSTECVSSGGTKGECLSVYLCTAQQGKEAEANRCPALPSDVQCCFNSPPTPPPTSHPTPPPTLAQKCTSSSGVEGTCIHKDLCSSQEGKQTEIGRCPNLPADILCCYEAPEPPSCTTTTGISGECIDTGVCSSQGKQYQSNRCPNQPTSVKCCFTPPCTSSTQISGGCLKQSVCLAQAGKMVENGCDGLPTDVKCCFDNPNPNEEVGAQSCLSSTGVLGSCISEGSCTGGKKIEAGRCPNLPADIKCCYAQPCTSSGNIDGQCLSLAACQAEGKVVEANRCPNLPNDVQCCFSTPPPGTPCTSSRDFPGTCQNDVSSCK